MQAQRPADDEIYLTIPQVAELVAVRVRTVRAWVAEKQTNGIPAQKIGGSIRFRLDRLKAWLDSR